MADINAFEGLPRKHFGCFVADPPWAYKSFTPLTEDNWDQRRDAEKHYPTMSLADIKALPVSELAAKDAHLWLWTTGPFLPDAFAVMKAWGFKFSGSGLVWIKLKKTHDRKLFTINSDEIESALFMGGGYTTRKNAEFCLLARRGGAKRMAADVREVILAPVREHSRKPEESYRRIERYVGDDVAKLELFARQSRPGWTTWGNQSAKFDPEMRRAA